MQKFLKYKKYGLFLEEDLEHEGKYFVSIFKGSSQVERTEWQSDAESAYLAAKNTVDAWT